MGEFEKLAYEATLRGLAKQESMLKELSTRASALLAASSLAASALAQQAFRNPDPPGLAIAALVAFAGTIAACVFILLPRRSLIFAEAGTGLYESLYRFRDNMPEVHRHLSCNLNLFWHANDKKIKWLAHAYTVAASALVLETFSLVVLLANNIR